MKWLGAVAAVALAGVGGWWWWKRRSDGSGGAMQINARGLDLVKSFEAPDGPVLEAYPDPGTGGDPWTIGYGHTGPEVVPGYAISDGEAEQLLRQDLATAERGVSDALEVPVSDNQFAAMVSLAFNIGVHAFSGSTLVRRVNSGDLTGAADEFPRWNKAAGQVLAGLTRRRLAERDLFLSDSAGGVA